MSFDDSLNKAQKLVRIIEMLDRREDVPAQELMAAFELDTRKLRRYLADLKSLGVPLVDTGSGETRRIGLESTYRRSGVRLTLPELLSLHFGRRLFTFLDGTQFAADMDDAIERLQPAVPRAEASLLADLDRRFLAVAEHAKDYEEMGDVIDEVITALIYGNPARAEYTRADGGARDYTLEPYTLATYRQGLYLFARDRADGRVKTFAVERFARFDRLRMEKFSVPDDFDPEAFVADAFGIIAGEPQRVVAAFHPQVAPYVRERRWHASQQVEDLDDGWVRLTMDVAPSQELVTWLLGFGGQVRVEGPEALVGQVRAAHRRALERLSR